MYLTYCGFLLAAYVFLAGTTFLGPAARRRVLTELFAWAVWVGLFIALIVHVVLQG
jgi:hypothetical protein